MDASCEGRVVTEQRNRLLTRGLLGRRPLSECYKYSLEGAYKELSQFSGKTASLG